MRAHVLEPLDGRRGDVQAQAFRETILFGRMEEVVRRLRAMRPVTAVKSVLRQADERARCKCEKEISRKPFLGWAVSGFKEALSVSRRCAQPRTMCGPFALTADGRDKVASYCCSFRAVFVDDTSIFSASNLGSDLVDIPLNMLSGRFGLATLCGSARLCASLGFGLGPSVCDDEVF